MNVLLTNKNELSNHPGIGGKASNLVRLSSMDINVPKWGVIPQNVLLDQLDLNTINEAQTDFKSRFNHLSVPNNLDEELERFFGENARNITYAIRSSAMDEDGSTHSFAGQFETYLHVPFDEIKEHVKLIWKSVVSDRVLAYRKENKLEMHYGIGVIIQELIPSEISGVAFGIDPVSGDQKTKIISSVFGLGEGLVSGELDADTYTVTSNETKKQLATKTHAFVQNVNRTGIEKVALEIHKEQISSLNEAQIDQLCNFLDELNLKLKGPQDIEFCFYKDVLYLLQTRPVTAIGNLNKPGEKEGEYILWDNSNIIESYPGITTPLTYSFIIKMYEMVYRQFAGILGVREKELNHHSAVFANTLGLVRGRVYYNLLSWYKMLAMVPGYSINAENMERMMGVKERFELEEGFQMNKGIARLRIVGMVFNMIWMLFRLPKERGRFIQFLNKVMSQYQQMDFDSMAIPEIVENYNRFESSLLLKWKAPLINDFFSMIWFGMLQKKTEALFPTDPNIHNDLLCGSQDIISVEPIHRSIAIAQLVENDTACKTLFETNSPEEIWTSLCAGDFADVKQSIDAYLMKFGNRCVGELKLETISYIQNPTLFVKVIKAYVQQGIVSKNNKKKNESGSRIEDELRAGAEAKVNTVFKGKSLKKWWFNYILNKTRDLVSNRENLRYERTRGFGMVRTMFSALGKQLHSNGFIDHPRDVFYLKLDEIKTLKNQVFESAFQTNIEARKKEFETYKNQPPPEERFFTYGNEFTDEYIYSKEKLEGAEDDLKGIGCCPGIVQAKVHVVLDPNDIDSLNGDILVTSSTDPGWVTLFPTASAIIVERGSLLSHSAIVSREMGIPCIVSVTGLLRTLKTGDEVLMDGSTGTIKLIATHNQ